MTWAVGRTACESSNKKQRLNDVHDDDGYEFHVHDDEDDSDTHFRVLDDRLGMSFNLFLSALNASG